MLIDIHRQLGIPADYADRCGMPPQAECAQLVDAGRDMFGRPVLLERATRQAWQQLQSAAAADGETLLLVSGYRSHDYQRQLIQRKLDRGQSIADILRVNAAPGFSEHHSGRALDLACPDQPPLEEAFEDTSSFRWLLAHAARYGFRLSFPRHNPQGVAYEPWHWFFEGPGVGAAPAERA
jgi:D-alanyl-D-alanine carboxypeptidase